MIILAGIIFTCFVFRIWKVKKAEIEYQSIIDAEISENEEFRKIVKENEKWNRISELG